jgi:hypothetical protein
MPGSCALGASGSTKYFEALGAVNVNRETVIPTCIYLNPFRKYQAK